MYQSVYWKFIKMNFKAGLQYKGWWLMIFQVLLVVVTDPISLLLMFVRFGSIGPWTMERILLIYAMAVTGFGLAESFLRGFDYFPSQMIRTGLFDRVLLRPAPLFIQIAGSYFHLHRLSRVVSGLAAILWCLWRMHVLLTPLKILMLLLSLLGSFITYSGVFVFTSGLAFFTIQGLDWIYIFTNASYQVTRIPMNHMPKLLKNTFTFFMPMLLVSYYPASALCGWGTPLWIGFSALPASIVFFILSMGVFQIGVRHYTSTGS